MPELTFENIEFISGEVSGEEIVFSHLAPELIDHICCDVENEMGNGLSFSDAYALVKNKMGAGRLKQIQEETLYAVDTKYRNMKKLAKISGVAGTVLLSFAALFKIMHWPGAGVMMTLGAFVLALVFLSSALIVLWKETRNSKRIFLFVSAFITGMLLISGFLFKIQHWQGAGTLITLALASFLLVFLPVFMADKFKNEKRGVYRFFYLAGAAAMVFYFTGLLFKIQHWQGSAILMLAGLFLFFIIVLPGYTISTWKNEQAVSVRFIFAVVGSMAIVIPATLINLSMQRSYDSGFYQNLQQQQALYDFNSIYNLSLRDSLSDSASYTNAGRIHEKTTALLKIIDEGTKKLRAESEGGNGPFDAEFVKNYLLPGCEYREKLDLALSDYSSILSSMPGAENRESYLKLTDPSLFLPQESISGNRLTVITGMHSLMLLRNSIMAVEASAIGAIGK